MKDSVASQCCDMAKRTKKAWAKWRRMVSEQERSGQTVTEFCENVLCLGRISWCWKKRLTG